LGDDKLKRKRKRNMEHVFFFLFC